MSYSLPSLIMLFNVNTNSLMEAAALTTFFTGGRIQVPLNSYSHCLEASTTFPFLPFSVTTCDFIVAKSSSLMLPVAEKK